MNFLGLESSIRWVFLAHALAGGLALGVMAVPLVSRKGSKTHIRAGWVYVSSMFFVGFSALVITPWRAALDPTRTQASISFAVFLAYIAVFTLSALFYGLIVLKAKNRSTPSRASVHLGFPIFTLLAGLLTQFIGLKLGQMLLVFFPFLGHVTSMGQLRYWLSAPTEKMHWWYAHMSGMFVACIATITAFLVTALPRVWTGSLATSPIVWIAPGIILGAVLNRWTAKYRAQFASIDRPLHIK